LTADAIDFDVGEVGFGGEGDDVDMEEALPIFPSNRIQPLNYSRTSKKVDIKLLKDNIWTSLADKPVVEFTKMVGELGSQYEGKAWKDISVQFCFICLLHLANENGLEVKGNLRAGDVCNELVISK